MKLENPIHINRHIEYLLKSKKRWTNTLKNPIYSEMSADIKVIESMKNDKPSEEEAREAVRTLIRWAGENPDRPGLVDTPARMIKAYQEYFSGYKEDPAKVLSKTFEDIHGYDDFVLVKEIDFVSHCEHHLAPITGIAHIAYWPDKKIVGISKLARAVDIFARRMVSQENMTREITDVIHNILSPKGTAVYIDAHHACMSHRGTFKKNSTTVTSLYTGLFKDEPHIQNRFLKAIAP